MAPLPNTSSLFQRAVRRRWWLVLGAVAALICAGPATGTDVAWSQVAELLLLGGAANLGAGILGRRGLTGRSAWIGALVLDLIITGTPIALSGLVGIAVLPLVATLPYASDDEGLPGAFAALSGGITVLLAQWIANGGDLSAAAIVEGAIVSVVGIGLRDRAALTEARLRRIAEGLRRASVGDLSSPLSSNALDPVGIVEAAFDQMSSVTATLLTAVQRDSGEAATVAGELSAATGALQRSADVLSGAAARLAHDLQQQRLMAEDSRRQGEGAAAESELQRERFRVLEGEEARLVAVAERAREQVARASDTLVSVGNEVATTGRIVSELTAMSTNIGGFAETIARIARQTHLLSLNAAIEAARAEGDGHGFSVVAEQVRALAAQAGRSAREVGELVGELQAGIAAAEHAMSSGGSQVEDIARVAREADAALLDLTAGVRRSAERVAAAAEGTRTQAEHQTALRQVLDRVSDVSHGAASSSDAAARSAQQQIQAMTELTASAQRLTFLAERLRTATAHLKA
ncbi:MAG TPA: methyl-accepting chemotaxis protein [Gemmatimonadales bacterium]|nr:methyl-accepting chemotaxis protein [Gemmatimonadales bacterium]